MGKEDVTEAKFPAGQKEEEKSERTGKVGQMDFRLNNLAKAKEAKRKQRLKMEKLSDCKRRSLVQSKAVAGSIEHEEQLNVEDDRSVGKMDNQLDEPVASTSALPLIPQSIKMPCDLLKEKDITIQELQAEIKKLKKKNTELTRLLALCSPQKRKSINY
ncbi:unnamed protein product [Bursaphelenchus okinawaensis]|uniref:Uncharacterized protein n=1 Tax=Bursaphelenchus okinawaensis TaxID=465554 RepID=A0A811KAU9_9BILA|nr:unnamed protein product [Bursaphelenchus okinawaensis]CAG9096392.1 unnamed protein product [Bursaphelenchus okinawaensis]